jgi:simple sugar transport system permease protein
MDMDAFIALLATAVSAGTPLLYAALGEILCERSGVLNLGVEGMMLAGAVCGFLVAVETKSPAAGIVAAMLAGGALAAIHAFMTTTLRVNQIISGLALALFGTGLSSYIGKHLIGVPLPVGPAPVPFPGLSEIPLLGPVFFRQDLLVYVSYLLVPLAWCWIHRTRPGLHLRAVGENPATADAMGVNVYRVRYACIIAGGMLAGLGGAYLSLFYAPCWVENMTAGRGWIALALVIFAVWSPLRAMTGAWLFGGIEALGFRIQILGAAVSPFFLKMLPYLFTIFVLVAFTAWSRKKRIRAPEALGLPYERE